MYSAGDDYYKCESNLVRSLLRCFQNACEESGMPSEQIKQEVTIVGSTRVDFLLGNNVSFEVKFEPDYPEMPATRKPVTNVVLKTPDPAVAERAGLTEPEATTRMYEVELDFLKLLAYKKTGIPHNYLLCLDEDGRLVRNLHRSFKTSVVKKLEIPWKETRRGKDGKSVHYFLWKA